MNSKTSYLDNFKAIGGPNFFFLKINIGFYMKANCINYKLIFTELEENN